VKSQAINPPESKPDVTQIVTTSDEKTWLVPAGIDRSPIQMDAYFDTSDFVQSANLRTELLSIIYPVGSIYMSVTNNSPENFLGGRWVPWGGGRVPLGIGNNNETDYTIPEDEGGSENSLASHSHTTNSTSKVLDGQFMYGTGTSGGIAASGANSTLFSQNGTGGSFSNGHTAGSANPIVRLDATHTHGTNTQGIDKGNRMPFITCYMWKRTS
jgi:hypothetical protein